MKVLDLKEFRRTESAPEKEVAASQEISPDDLTPHRLTSEPPPAMRCISQPSIQGTFSNQPVMQGSHSTRPASRPQSAGAAAKSSPQLNMAGRPLSASRSRQVRPASASTTGTAKDAFLTDLGGGPSLTPKSRRYNGGQPRLPNGFDQLHRALGDILEKMDGTTLNEKWDGVSKYLSAYKIDATAQKCAYACQKVLVEAQASGSPFENSLAVVCVVLDLAFDLLSQWLPIWEEVTGLVRQFIMGAMFVSPPPPIEGIDIKAAADAPERITLAASHYMHDSIYVKCKYLDAAISVSRLTNKTFVKNVMNVKEHADHWKSMYLRTVFTGWRMVSMNGRRLAKEMKKLQERSIFDQAEYERMTRRYAEMSDEVNRLQSENRALMREKKELALKLKNTNNEAERKSHALDMMLQHNAALKEQLVALQENNKKAYDSYSSSEDELSRDVSKIPSELCKMESLQLSPMMSVASMSPGNSRRGSNSSRRGSNTSMTKHSSVYHLPRRKEINVLIGLFDTCCKYEYQLRNINTSDVFLDALATFLKNSVDQTTGNFIEALEEEKSMAKIRFIERGLHDLHLPGIPIIMMWLRTALDAVSTTCAEENYFVQAIISIVCKHLASSPQFTAEEKTKFIERAQFTEYADRAVASSGAWLYTMLSSFENGLTPSREFSTQTLENEDEEDLLRHAYVSRLNVDILRDILPKDMDKGASLVKELKDIIYDNIQALNQVYIFYSSGDKKLSNMSEHEFWSFCTDAQIFSTDLQESLTARTLAKRIYLMATRLTMENPDSQHKTLVEIGQAGWVECLVRLGRELKTDLPGLSLKLKAIISTVLTHAQQLQVTGFRSEIYHHKMQVVIEAWRRRLLKVYNAYALKDRKMSIANFKSLIKDMQLHGAHKLSQEDQVKIFNSVQIGQDGLDDIIYAEFIEAMVATAVYVDPCPFAPLPKRCEFFFKHHVWDALKNRI